MYYVKKMTGGDGAVEQKRNGKVKGDGFEKRTGGMAETGGQRTEDRGVAHAEQT